MALGGGGAIEFGYVVTDKNYVQHYYTIYSASTISAGVSYNIFFVKPVGKDVVTISDWKGRCFEVGGNYGYLNVQFGGSSGGNYITYTVGFGAGVSFPYKGTGGGFAGTTYLIGGPMPILAPGPYDFAGVYWYYRAILSH